MNGEHAEEYQQPTLRESPKPQSVNSQEKESQASKRKNLGFVHIPKPLFKSFVYLDKE